VKKELDMFIKKVNNKYYNDFIYSTQFTGKRIEDDIVIRNENKYKNVDKNKSKNKNNKFNDISKAYLKSKQKVNIDAKIENIEDILNLINSYKCDPKIEYNINMSPLHNIKEPLEKLNNMIGMKQFKNNILDQLLYFIQDLHLNKEKESGGDFMHTVLSGPPGTGKTEIAMILGKIYSKLGVLSKGTFTKVTRSDLVAGYLGQTAIKTRDVIKAAIGGVLFIDEAYSLGNAEKRDSFAKECIDTLCEALSDNKKDLMVIIAGYETELKECFFNYNQGLDSRFTWRFKMDNYSAEDLYNIFIKKVKDIDWTMDANSTITVDWFKKNFTHFKSFGRDIETLLAKTKIAHGRRIFGKIDTIKKEINISDLDKGFEMYLQNEDSSKTESEYFKKHLHNTMYC